MCGMSEDSGTLLVDTPRSHTNKLHLEALTTGRCSLGRRTRYRDSGNYFRTFPFSLGSVFTQLHLLWHIAQVRSSFTKKLR